MNRRITALMIATVALFGLTACTAFPAASPTATSTAEASETPEGDGQSVAEACALVQDTIEQAAEDFRTAAQDDPAAVVEAMKNAAAELSAAAGQITNEDVAAVLPGVEEMFTTTAEILQDIVEGDVSKIGELATIGETFQETVQQFEDLCARE